jgi:hypothetical protein
MGVSDIYCVICGVTATQIHWYKNDLEELQTIIDNGKFNIPSKSKFSSRKTSQTQDIEPALLENYKKYVKDLNKLSPSFKWCDNLYLLTDKKLIKNLNQFISGDYGSYEHGTEYYETQSMFWKTNKEGENNKGLICHRDCYKLLSEKCNYNLRLNDITSIINNNSLLSNYGSIVNIYTGQQDFPWTEMILNVDQHTNYEQILVKNKKLIINEHNVNFLLSPLENNKNMNRIIKIWTPIIKKIKSKINKPQKIRPSPSISATTCKVGAKKIGNDNNKYIIVENKNGVKRWQKF